MQPGLRSGKLTKWKDERGFGFIQPVDGSEEVFLHISEVKEATRRPQENDTIYYHCITDSDGKVRACNAFILGARNKSAKLFNAKAYSFPIVEVVFLSLLPLVGAVHFTWTTRNPLPLILYPAMSLVTSALYADDKSRAQQKDRRTSGQTLHLCEIAGGWLGAFIARANTAPQKSERVLSSYALGDRDL
jgi:cold shock CspA family protein